LMSYIGGVGYFVGPIVGAIVITFLQISLSDVTDVWQLYLGLLFIGFVMFAPGGIVGWLMLHRDAMLKRQLWGLAPAYAMVAPALMASFVGAVMLIELAERQLALARSEGSAMRLFGFTVDAASLAPWSIAVILFCGGVGVTWLLWPKVTDAWGAVNIPLTARGQAWASSSR
jgi:branched-chain amino acid transport system permease protein